MTMVARHVLSSPARCSNCHVALLNAFTSHTGVTFRPILKPRHSARLTTIYTLTRPFAQISLRTLDVVQKHHILDVETETEPNPENSDQNDTVESTPWYLQVETPRRPSSTLLERQRVPELPSDPPPLLQPMLEHISVDLGLDDLTVFDLRKIDPPPALGANLLMILGTARSEKHLHISADRFCRWLKTTHNLSPFADGLLGKGELKLKQRRKARRARLLSNVGSSETSNIDDGLRTGWICVNVGNIEDGRNTVEDFPEQEGYVGFGGEIGGAKVVIQMLTEEKREQLDLEDLWGKMVRRQERKEARISKGPEELLSQQEVGPSPLRQKHSRFDSYSITPLSLPQPASKLNQARHFHSCPISRSSATDQFVSELRTDKKGDAPDHSEHARTLLRLRAHVDHLKSIPSEDAKQIMGRGMFDADSTPFLRSFYQSLPLFPDAKHWECRLALACYGTSICAPGYDKKRLSSIFKEMQSSVIDIPAALFLQVFKTLLLPTRQHLKPVCQLLDKAYLYEAANVLEEMSFRGHNIALEDVRLHLQNAVDRVSIEQNGGAAELRPNASRRLRQLFNGLLKKPSDIDSELHRLNFCAEIGNWKAFWDVWRGFAREMRPRPKDLYVAMFRGVAQSGHQARNMDALREWVPEMDQEEPPVSMDAAVAEAIQACLVVAEPSLESIAVDESSLESEWVQLWRRCQRAIQFDTTGP